MKCKCPPTSPFHWARNPRPSIFATDANFKPKGQQPVDASLTKEQNLIAYKQFSIYARANPMVKPTLNKHEL